MFSIIGSSSSFNPRPACRPGATPKIWSGVVQCGEVSILARPAGRTLPLQAVQEEWDESKFQSSPGLQAGRYLDDRTGKHPVEVSILARPAGRALLIAVASPARVPVLVSILARPAGRALRAREARPRRARRRVSILARPAGRALLTLEVYVCGHCRFQSSPGLQAGRYVPELHGAHGSRSVSILARPAGRALHRHATERRRPPREFQSSPGLQAGRYVRRPR